MALQAPSTHLIPRQTYTVSETAALLGISIQTAYTAVHKGDIRAIRVSKRLLVPVGEIDRLLHGTPDTEGDRHAR
jgi:excisionase family DNA binding protein